MIVCEGSGCQYEPLQRSRGHRGLPMGPVSFLAPMIQALCSSRCFGCTHIVSHSCKRVSCLLQKPCLKIAQSQVMPPTLRSSQTSAV